MPTFRSNRLCLLLVLLAAGCRYHAPSTGGDGGDVAVDLATRPTDGPVSPTGGDMTMAPPAGSCPVTFRYAPNGRVVGKVVVAGEFNDWKGAAMQPDGGGGFTASAPIMPGLWAYKLVIDDKWELDPGSGLRKYVNGIENSAVRVADCALPVLTLAGKTIARPGANKGRFTGMIKWRAGSAGAAIDPARVKATLRKDGQSQPIASVMTDAGTGAITVDAGDLADGKYTILVDAADRDGRAAKALRLVFWIEAEPFDWRDAVIYMAMTDRFVNADKAGDATPTMGVDPRLDFHGGDLQGIAARVKDGTFDKLGVRALWLSPFHRNPAGAWLADDGVHKVMGYHGYWPVRAREVEPRIGGDAALSALVAEAHAHGIRVLQDFVVNHVHRDHEYFQAHPDWFRTGCVCGSNNCDWTTHRLDCLFADYLPDVDWTVPAVSEQYADDAAWWLDRFDLDGLRVDAVKHVEDACALNLTARIRDEFEAAGTRVFLTGETAMGWSDCGLQCNADQYGTIARYIGPLALDGQADFVLYHAVPYRVFSSDEKGMIHVDYWTKQSQLQYPAGAIMTPYIGSHDTSRFVTLASYRGQDQAHNASIPGNKWTSIAAAPPDAEPYARHRLGLAWLYTVPGAPMVYYGDEYGEWGGADPNNRVDWRGGMTLAAEEQATLDRARALGAARRELPALRRGTYVSVYSSEDSLLFARQAGNDVALVALSKNPAPATIAAPIPPGLGLSDGTVLKDRLGGANVTVTNKSVTIMLPARGAAILAP